MMSEVSQLAIIIAGFLLLLVAIVAGYLQLRQIHAAVNSNMTVALNKIDELHGVIAGLVAGQRELEEGEEDK